MGFKFEFPAFVSRKRHPGTNWPGRSGIKPLERGQIWRVKKQNYQKDNNNNEKKKNRLESRTSNAISPQSLSISRQAPVPRICNDRNSKLYRRFQLQRQWWFNFQRFLYKATYVTYLSHCTLPYISQKRAMYHEDFTTRFFSSNCPLPASTSSRETKNFPTAVSMWWKWTSRTSTKQHLSYSLLRSFRWKNVVAKQPWWPPYLLFKMPIWSVKRH